MLNGLASMVVPLKPYFALLVLSRVLTGLFLSVFLIYFPVWIDLKAPPHWQTMWICMFYYTEDLGMAVGYGLSSMFSAFNISWVIGFYIQAGTMACIMTLMFLVIPEEHFQNSSVDVGQSSGNYCVSDKEGSKIRTPPSVGDTPKIMPRDPHESMEI